MRWCLLDSPWIGNESGIQFFSCSDPAVLLLQHFAVGPAALFRPSDQQGDLLSLVSVPKRLIGCWGCSCIDMHLDNQFYARTSCHCRPHCFKLVAHKSCRHSLGCVLSHSFEHLLLAWRFCIGALPAKDTRKYDLQCEPCTSCCTCDR